MTNKERVIEVFEKAEITGSYDDCDLCILFGVMSPLGPKDCRGCPLARENKSQGCNSIVNLTDEYYGTRHEKQVRNFIYDKSEEAIEILEKIPARRFTKSGWTYFKELDKLRNDIDKFLDGMNVSEKE